ncbi:MAG: molybdenum cofactor guanylyltransferase MobA [Sulfurovum sp.]|nr:molybdenum cofactor guanylyltransferase MobA [Sulfurovum sp.]MCB4772398.1 molybdenum cofactor guanylyltransferase MobA [Sulfurovum sp.]
MKHIIPAVIFAGGKSSRMGKDKALLPFGAYESLAAYQYHRLNVFFNSVYLSTKTDKFGFDAPLIMDRYKVYSPLTALVSAFEVLDEEAIFILSVDTPFVDNTVIQNIITTRQKEDAIIARTNNKIQPLCGLYVRSMLPLAQEALTQRKHRLTRFLEEINTKYVDFEDEKLFLNLNHPFEYKAAKKLISSKP